MNLIYITGSSSGLGKALAELLLEDNNNQVVGVARRKTIQHERYTHYSLDLKELINENILTVEQYKTQIENYNKYLDQEFQSSKNYS